MALVEDLLRKVKANLIIEHDEDDELICDYIRAAVDYAETGQNKPQGYYFKRGNRMPPSTEQAVIMLASHYYESRDGSTGGFFADNTSAAAQIWQTVDRLLLRGKDWVV